jgi:hypothetical protein
MSAQTREQEANPERGVIVFVEGIMCGSHAPQRIDCTKPAEVKENDDPVSYPGHSIGWILHTGYFL